MSAAASRSDAYRVARTVLAELPCPVVIIAAAHGDERSCATGTAMYVSFMPPALAIAVHPGSRTGRLIEASGEFSVSLLGEDQMDAAVRGGRSARGSDKLAELGLGVAVSDRSTAPALAAAPLMIWCRVTHRHSAGDHVVVVGEVIDHRQAPQAGRPLIRHRRRYAGPGEWLSDELDESYPT